jgi:hypothetical protein
MEKEKKPIEHDGISWFLCNLRLIMNRKKEKIGA